jgi:hypothetical protein
MGKLRLGLNPKIQPTLLSSVRPIFTPPRPRMRRHRQAGLLVSRAPTIGPHRAAALVHFSSPPAHRRREKSATHTMPSAHLCRLIRRGGCCVTRATTPCIYTPTAPPLPPMFTSPEPKPSSSVGAEGAVYTMKRQSRPPPTNEDSC